MSVTSFENKLGQLCREFFASHPDVKLIGVTGSAGKMSAKVAIATVLSRQYAVGMHEPAPTSRAETLLQIMGVTYPDQPVEQWGFWAKRRMLKAVKQRARAEKPDVQVIVQEFNATELGYNDWFRQFIVPDIAVITSVTTGRMRVDNSLEQVAQEMLTLANNSKFAIINRDDIDGRFAAFLTTPQITTYGSSAVAEYWFDEESFSLQDGRTGKMISPEHPEGLTVRLSLLGEHNVRPAIAAMTVGVSLGINPENIASALGSLTALPGRMSVLRGADGTTLIDDSYSSSPLTAVSALQTLYSLNVPQKIAVLGTMNGLRESAPQGHAELGSHCSSSELDWVVTVGANANQYLAPAARQQGCQVKECRDAIEAGAFVREKLKADGVALFKGSSGGVWLEEAVKINLHSTDDEKNLVRQEPDWLAHKKEFFSRFGDPTLKKKKG